MAPDNLVASAAYQPEPTAAAAARRFVRDTLHGWVVTGASADGNGVVDDAVLLTSELVTNAVVHAGTAVQVTCRMAEDSVEVVVSDNHPARLVPEPAESAHPSAERTSGRGLLLPAALASAWGVTYGRVTKSVWFRLGVGHPLTAGKEQGSGTGTGAEGKPSGEQGTDSVLLAALRAAAPDRAGRSLPDRDDDGYSALLASTLEAARAAVGADAAFALMPDEDGDLRLRAAVGDMPALATAAPGAAALPQGAWLPAAGPSAQAEPSVATVPFVVDGQVTGLLAVAAAAPGKFSEAETANLQRLADRWGLSLRQAWLASLEQIRRSRMAALAEARGLLTSGLTETQIMELAGHAMVPRIAEWCAVLLRDPHAGLRVAYVCHADVTRVRALTEVLSRACQRAAPPGLWAGASPSPWRQWSLAEAGRPAAGPAGSTGPSGSARAAGAAGAVGSARAAGGAGAGPGGGSGGWAGPGTAWCFPLAPDGDGPGVFVLSPGPGSRLARETGELAADFACRIGVALGNVSLVQSSGDGSHASR